MPLVSIIIPVYNTEKYLRTCLNSVVRQNYQNIEIIIVEDKSPDNANFILYEYEKNFKNIKVIHNPTNLGIATTRNIGLEQANGDFILFVDSDDYIDTTTIADMIYLSQEYSINLVSFHYATVLGAVKWRKERQNNQLIIPVIEDMESNPNLLLSKTGHCWRNFYGHSLIENLRFPDGMIYEDNAFTYPAFTKAGKILKTENTYYYYRRNLNSTTLKVKMKPTVKILDIFKACDYTKHNCEKLGTYQFYHEAINQIMIANSLIPSLTATTWLQMKREEQKLLIQLLYQYSKSHYGFNGLDEIPFIQARRQESKLYNLRIQYLQSFLEKNNSIQEDETIYLERAKQLIKKY